jgi:murein L,D-transpeptidase YafK
VRASFTRSYVAVAHAVNPNATAATSFRMGGTSQSPVVLCAAMRWLWVALCLLMACRSGAADLKDVRKRRAGDVKALVEKAGVAYPAQELYLRAFKKERKLELWASAKGKPMTLVKTYDFCAASGELGPKRKEGDLQVPEGLYEISQFNPGSNFHLSMKVSYPNASDRVRSDPKQPGGLIYIHGDCVSVGCIAIQNEPIEEVYLLAESVKTPIRVDIFPMKLDGPIEGEFAEFWKELAPAYTGFEATKRPAKFTVSKAGAYVVK